MFTTIKTVIISSLLSLTYSQVPPFSTYTTKFRPSPVDKLGNLGLNNFSPADYIINLKAPSFQPTPFKDYQHYNTFPLAGSRPLFTPAETPFPAETPGQIDNFNKALQEEALATQNNQNQFFNPPNNIFNPPSNIFNSGFSGPTGFTSSGLNPGLTSTSSGFTSTGLTPPGLQPPGLTSAVFNQGFGGSDGFSGKSYVNVRFGPQNNQYQYSV